MDMTTRTSIVVLVCTAVLLVASPLDACNITEVCKLCECPPESGGRSVMCKQLFLVGKSFFPMVCPNVTKLTIFESDIAEINDTDLAHLVQLKVFKITNSPLVTLSENAFDSLAKLEMLLIQNTSLTMLPAKIFAGLANVLEITVSENAIANITLEHFSQLNATLETINLSRNKIADITNGFFNNTMNSLTSLDLSHNSLTGLDNITLGFLSQVTYLTVESNNLGEVASDAFDGMTSLETLNLAGNKLAALPGDAFLNSPIKNLNISDNLFNDMPIMPISTMDKLEVLDLDLNILTEINDGVFSSLFHLKELHLSHLIFLTSVHEGAFDMQAPLEKLYLCHNPQLTDIHPNAFSAGIATLKELYINDNGLMEIPEAMFNGTVLSGLTVVEAQGNPLLCSCVVIWMRSDMDDTTINWIQPWKDGETAVTCAAPERFNGTKVHDTDIETLTCDPPLILDEVHFLDSIKENYVIEVWVSGGLPTTKWTTVNGITLEAGDKHTPSNGNDIISVSEKLLTNDTVLSRLHINHPTYASKGYYTLHVMNAAGVIQQQYMAQPPDLPNNNAKKIGLIVGLVVGGVAIITLVGCLVYVGRKKTYQRMHEEREEEDTSDRPTYGSVDVLVNETESAPANTEQA